MYNCLYASLRLSSCYTGSTLISHSDFTNKTKDTDVRSINSKLHNNKGNMFLKQQVVKTRILKMVFNICVEFISNSCLCLDANMFYLDFSYEKTKFPRENLFFIGKCCDINNQKHSI